jgi:2-keto-myo-inositol isomerase
MTLMVGRGAFALNHMCAPRLRLTEFMDLAVLLGVGAVEIRNDLDANAILDGTAPEAVREMAHERGLRIISINALQRFNQWTAVRASEARELIGYAAACGAEALVLVPVNDGSGRANGERQAQLRIALKALRPMLAAAGVVGLVEPLGFEICSLRLKSEAVGAIRSLEAGDVFRVVHDTFHHLLAGEREIYPAETGLIHISGVTDPVVSVSEMRDPHRVLVGAGDRIDNIGQISALRGAGCKAPLSFEPFSEEVHGLADLQGALGSSMDFILERTEGVTA